MANVEKYDLLQINGLLKHFDRTFISDNIDHERTHLNYNLAPVDNAKERLNELLENVKHINRKDLKVACDIVVTCPQNVPETLRAVFFKKTYEFMSTRYGSKTGLLKAEDNVLSAWVHMDEKTPHLHFCFAPIRYDNQKGVSKFDCKNIINRQDLRTLHGDFQKFMSENGFGAAKVSNGGTLYKRIEINGNERFVPCSIKDLRQNEREHLHNYERPRERIR